jgi:hypothetical protein
VQVVSRCLDERRQGKPASDQSSFRTRPGRASSIQFRGSLTSLTSRDDNPPNKSRGAYHFDLSPEFPNMAKSATPEPFPELVPTSSVTSRSDSPASNGTLHRPRKSSNLRGDPRGDTAGPALATLYDRSPGSGSGSIQVEKWLSRTRTLL